MTNAKLRSSRITVRPPFALFVLPAILVTGSAAQTSPVKKEPKNPGGAVLLELFTSEGCSSCPPADALLTQLATISHQEGVELIPLSFHVDYWNGLGWKDPYSSPAFTTRQRDYARCLGERSVYTPQLIVDGAVGLVGSDRNSVLEAVESARKEPKATILLSTAGVSDEPAGQIPIRVRVEPSRAHAGKPVEILVALAEDRVVSDVRRGENAGRRLKHTGVVRWTTSLGEWDLFASEGVTRTVQIPLGDDWKRRHLNVVAWLQGHSCGGAVGVARMAITPSHEP